jgi:hypothetical protein
MREERSRASNESAVCLALESATTKNPKQLVSRKAKLLYVLGWVVGSHYAPHELASSMAPTVSISPLKSSDVVAIAIAATPLGRHE